MSRPERRGRNWVAVACADHVAIGVAAGVMQVGHGKRAPLERVTPGDRVVYYSPARQIGGTPPLQAFTAIGTVREGDVYQHDMGNGFVPWRRDVDFVNLAVQAPIRPLLERLRFTQPVQHWGAKFRYGFFEIDDADFAVIAGAMQVEGQLAPLTA